MSRLYEKDDFRASPTTPDQPAEKMTARRRRRRRRHRHHHHFYL